MTTITLQQRARVSAMDVRSDFQRVLSQVVLTDAPEDFNVYRTATNLVHLGLFGVSASEARHKACVANLRDVLTTSQLRRIRAVESILVIHLASFTGSVVAMRSIIEAATEIVTSASEDDLDLYGI